MFKSGFGNTGDFEAMARQYWSAWGEAMRQGGMGTTAQPQPAQQWQQAVDWWSQLLPDGRSQANDAVGRFNQQASQWFGQMQQVAAQFAGQDSNVAEVSQAWRRAMVLKYVVHFAVFWRSSELANSSRRLPRTISIRFWPDLSGPA